MNLSGFDQPEDLALRDPLPARAGLRRRHRDHLSAFRTERFETLPAVFQRDVFGDLDNYFRMLFRHFSYN